MDGLDQFSHLASSNSKALALAELKVFSPGSSISCAAGGRCSLLLDTAPSQRHKCYESNCMDSSVKQNESMSFQSTLQLGSLNVCLMEQNSLWRERSSLAFLIWLFCSRA